MKTDFEIARETPLKPITEIAESIGVPTTALEPYGKYIAKVPYTLIDEAKVKQSNLILVTSITPTKTGNGKNNRKRHGKTNGENTNHKRRLGILPSIKTTRGDMKN